jgi:hypothetical protein
MNDVQFRRDGNLPGSSAIRSMRHSQIHEGEGEGEGVIEVLNRKGVSSKPFRESPEPYQLRYEDYDVPSLTNGSSRGSRTPSVANGFEPPNLDLDIPSRDTKDPWPMPCSSDSQAIMG